MAKTAKSKISNNVFYTIITILVVVVLTGLMAYAVNSRDPLTAMVKKVYPAAIVGGNFVSIHDWELNLQIGKKLDSKKTGQEIGRVFLENLKKERIVQTSKIPVNAGKINQEYQFDISDSKAAHEDLVKNYFYDDEKLFIKYVVFPSFYDAQLRIQYNSNFVLNDDTYTKAQSILDRINKGEKFEDLAKTYSDDEFTGQVGGDLGLVTENQILPELVDILKSSQAGEIKKEIVVSRYGYHILYPSEASEKDGQKAWHLKHILIQTHGFENWLKPKLDDVWVWRAK